MSDEFIIKFAECTAETLEAANDLQRALVAAAALLAKCTCQKQRRDEAMAAIRLADTASVKWEAATRRLNAVASELHPRPQ